MADLPRLPGPEGGSPGGPRFPTTCLSHIIDTEGSFLEPQPRMSGMENLLRLSGPEGSSLDSQLAADRPPKRELPEPSEWNRDMQQFITAMETRIKLLENKSMIYEDLAGQNARAMDECRKSLQASKWTNDALKRECQELEYRCWYKDMDKKAWMKDKYEMWGQYKNLHDRSFFSMLAGKMKMGKLKANISTLTNDKEQLQKALEECQVESEGLRRQQKEQRSACQMKINQLMAGKNTMANEKEHLQRALEECLAQSEALRQQTQEASSICSHTALF